MTNEAFARVKIDQLLKDSDWRLTDGVSVRYEYPLDDGGRVSRLEALTRQLAAVAAKAEAMPAGLSAEVFDAGKRKDAASADGPSAPC